MSKLNTSRNMRDLTSFIVPKRKGEKKIQDIFASKKVIAIIPTYKPLSITVGLVQNLLDWHNNVHVFLVDDSSPLAGKHIKSLEKIKELAQTDKRLTYLRTPHNLLKAGAMNYGYYQIINNNIESDVIITCDDDVVLNTQTLPSMINTLFSSERLGAVCSNVKAINKNKNLLTRLQGLEYNSFNVAKLSDNGFFMGPLVMQGMLVAFRSEAFHQTGGFADNLIEDYEITARLKSLGWEVQLSAESWAETEVPDDIRSLWRQRIRWTYGGLTVLEKHGRSIVPVLQDIIGHGMFLILFALIGLSFTLPRSADPLELYLIEILIVFTYIQFSVSYLFNIYIMRFYRGVDWRDRTIRLSIIPEFLYSNFLTLVLLGSYTFYIYNKLYETGLILFDKLGYSLSWGTRK